MSDNAVCLDCYLGFTDDILNYIECDGCEYKVHALCAYPESVMGPDGESRMYLFCYSCATPTRGGQDG